MSLDLFDDALAGTAVHAEYDDGTLHLLDTVRWSGDLDAADRELVTRLDGPTLDIGCGPGRFPAALRQLGVDALGIDIATAAVRLTTGRGGHAVRASIFGEVPREGEWAHALLMDGNIGIGGDPVLLLARVADVLRPGGVIHAELDPAGREGRVSARLRTADGRVGRWFGWAHVTERGIDSVAGEAGLRCLGVWTRGTRCFAALSR